MTRPNIDRMLVTIYMNGGMTKEVELTRSTYERLVTRWRKGEDRDLRIQDGSWGMRIRTDQIMAVESEPVQPW